MIGDTYTTKSLNQYTPPTNPSESFTYDDDGNPTLDTADRAKLGIATQ